jgi:hypothetical protein
MTDFGCIVLALLMESQNQGLNTNLGVANVILDRGGKPCSVVTAPGQFSWYPRHRLRPFKAKNPAEAKAVLLAKRAARAALHGARAKGMKGKKFKFFNTRKKGKRFKTKNLMVASGDLVFY